MADDLEVAERQSFICAICERFIEMRWNSTGPNETIPPICRYCEGQCSRGAGRPTGGAFRDRRMVIQGFAISEALRSEASRQTWSARYV